MKYILFVVSIAVVFVSSVLAQTQSSALPENTYSPEKWKTYEFKADKFKVRLPGIPTETLAARDSNGIIVRSNLVMYVGEVGCVISSMEFSVDLEKTGQAAAALDNAKQATLIFYKDIEPEITKEEKFVLEGHPGKYIRIETNDDSVFRRMILVVNTHMYVVTVTSPYSDVESTENDYEKIAGTLFDSFKLIT